MTFAGPNVQFRGQAAPSAFRTTPCRRSEPSHPPAPPTLARLLIGELDMTHHRGRLDPDTPATSALLALDEGEELDEEEWEDEDDWDADEDDWDDEDDEEWDEWYDDEEEDL